MRDIAGEQSKYALRDEVPEPVYRDCKRLCADKGVGIGCLAAWVVRSEDPRLVRLPVVGVDLVQGADLRDRETRGGILSRPTSESLWTEAVLAAVSQGVSPAR